MKKYIKSVNDIDDYRGYTITHTGGKYEVHDSDDNFIDYFNHPTEAMAFIDELLESKNSKKPMCEEDAEYEATEIARNAFFADMEAGRQYLYPRKFAEYISVTLDEDAIVQEDTLFVHDMPVPVTYTTLNTQAEYFSNTIPYGYISIEDTGHGFAVIYNSNSDK